MKKGEFCCDSMKNMVAKGWVEHDVLPGPLKSERHYFVIHTDKPSPRGAGNLGIILRRCFVCGKIIYPGRDEKDYPKEKG